MNIKSVDSVFSPEEIDSLKSKVRVALTSRYGDKITYAEIAFGQFIEGVSLVYVGQIQDTINYVERHFSAQLAINEKGDFIPFKFKGKLYTGTETYLSDFNQTLISFSLKRMISISGRNLSTDDFNSWIDNGQFSDCVNCCIELADGKHDVKVNDIAHFISRDEDDEDEDFYYFYEDYDEEYAVDDIDTLSLKFLTFFVNSKSYTVSELNSDYASSILINSQYVLLVDNIMHYYNTDEEWWCDFLKRDMSDYVQMLERYELDKSDITKNRYGLYDIMKRKTIINVGELQKMCAFISGFRRIDISNGRIITFDILDIQVGKGIPYSKNIQNNSWDYADVYRLGRAFSKPQIQITQFWGNKESRSGRNAGEWYIFREGRNAGRTLCWLLANEHEADVIKYLKSNYISFDNFCSFLYPATYETGLRNKIWLLLDCQCVFEDVENAEDELVLTRPFSQRHIDKYSALSLDEWVDEVPSFEKLISDDPKYLIGLINHRSLYVNMDVFDVLEETYAKDRRYLTKLYKVKEAAKEYQDEIDEHEEYLRSEEEARWQEEDRWYREEGYRAAFDGDPEAEWNID